MFNNELSSDYPCAGSYEIKVGHNVAYNTDNKVRIFTTREGTPKQLLCVHLGKDGICENLRSGTTIKRDKPCIVKEQLSNPKSFLS